MLYPQQAIIIQEAKRLINFFYPFRLNTRPKVDYTAGLVFGLWLDSSKQMGKLFSPTDITSVMDDLVTNDDSLKTVQVWLVCT